MKIIITGFTGSGKSTLAKKLAKEFGLEYFSGGDLLRKLIAGEGSLREKGWWESERGEEAFQKRSMNENFDRKVDEFLLNVLRDKDDVVVDSWTAAYLYGGADAVKIYLKADLDERARRVSLRDGITFVDAKEAIKKKDKASKEQYRRLYGFNLGDDLTVFDLVIDTTHLNRDEVFDLVSRYLTYRFRRGSDGSD